LPAQLPPGYIVSMHDAVTLPSAVLDAAQLPDSPVILKQMVRELLATVGHLRSNIDQMQGRIDYLARMHYGRRSERMEGPSLFDGFTPPEPQKEEEAALPPEPEPTVVPKRKKHGRQRRLQELPRERVGIDVTEAEKTCPCCGTQRVKIGEEVSVRLDYRPACLFERHTARPTYLCRQCEQQGKNIQAVQAPLPPEPIARGTVGAGLLAYIIVSKWLDHLPLYRQESILGRLGWRVSRSTLCDQMLGCARVLTPLYEWMSRRIRESVAIHTNDTPVTLLNPRRTAYAWVYLGDADNPYTVFDLTVGRQHQYPEKFLAGYQGYIHADAYAGYNPLYAGGATHVGCWMHTRRNFFEAKESDPARAHEALARIRLLYAVEAECKQKGLQGAELAAYRQERAGPVLQGFADWLAQEVPRALPKSKIGEAMIYAANQWPTLVRYVQDGRLTIDNAPAEQAIRPLAVGRRNWLQIAGDGGLHSAAVLLSIAASAKRNRVQAWEYIQHILTACAARSADSDFSDLLPDAWAKAHPAVPVAS
jgi:transposase